LLGRSPACIGHWECWSRHVVEVDRSGLIGEYQARQCPHTRVLDKAMGACCHRRGVRVQTEVSARDPSARSDRHDLEADGRRPRAVRGDRAATREDATVPDANPAAVAVHTTIKFARTRVGVGEDRGTDGTRPGDMLTEGAAPSWRAPCARSTHKASYAMTLSVTLGTSAT